MDLHITRTFDAPLERVWKAWTEPEHIQKWWGPKGFTSPAAKVDFREGGKYLYCMRGPAGTEFDKDMWSGGEFTEIIPGKKIVATDHFADADGNYVSPKDYGMPGEWPEEMVVTATFEDLGNGKTKLTLLHTGHPAEMADMAKAGWNESLDKFAAAI
jgi:uncharacterized protein YndB with AHSA1/START domain